MARLCYTIFIKIFFNIFLFQFYTAKIRIIFEIKKGFSKKIQSLI